MVDVSSTTPHIKTHHNTTQHTTPHHAATRHNRPHHTTARHGTPRHTTPRDAAQAREHRVVQCSAMPWCCCLAVRCDVMGCRAVSCRSERVGWDWGMGWAVKRVRHRRGCGSRGMLPFGCRLQKRAIQGPIEEAADSMGRRGRQHPTRHGIYMQTQVAISCIVPEHKAASECCVVFRYVVLWCVVVL
jgi:hypothetical protein